MNKINEQKTSLTNFDTQELIDRFKATSTEERAIFLQCLETQELYAELGRRLAKTQAFVEELESVISEFNKDLMIH